MFAGTLGGVPGPGSQSTWIARVGPGGVLLGSRALESTSGYELARGIAAAPGGSAIPRSAS